MRAEDTRIPIFICVGTTKHILDSVAPRVGTILAQKGYIVIGTESNQVHAMNVGNLSELSKHFDKKYYKIIGVDAMYSKTDKKIMVKQRPLSPGKGVGKDLPEIGEETIGINIMHNSSGKSNWHFWHRMIFSGKKDEQLIQDLVECSVSFITKKYKKRG